MKGKSRLLIGPVFGIVIGWALGFLRLPHLEKNVSFLLGFIAALALSSLVLMMLAAWNRDFLPGLIGKKTATGDSKSTHTHTFIWITLVGILVLAGVLSGLTVHRHNESFKLQIQSQGKKLQKMEAMVAAANEYKPLMKSVLEDIGDELKHNPSRKLHDTTISRIAALSFSCKPYKYIEADSLSEKAFSPGRGQLLQALVLMKIDTGSFSRIKQKAVFTGADLLAADLKGVDLSGINLKNANLKDADLSGANLKGADLGEANLWGAKLNQANMSNANLKRADLSWAQLNEATLTLANLNGANLTNAQLRKADLTGATFQWAQSSGALFNEANLAKVNFYGSYLNKVNLSQTNLSYTDLRRTNLSEADLVGAGLNKALVDEKWLEKLKEWRPIGVTELQKSYAVVNDTFDKEQRPLYRLSNND